MNIKEPQYINLEHTFIDCMIEHPKFGWIPTTVDFDNDDRSELVVQLAKMSITDFIPEVIALSTTKETAQLKIEGFATQCRQTIAKNADYYKTTGWTDKRQRAARIKSSNPEPDDIAIVQQEISRRNKGETINQLVDIQLAKAKTYAFATSEIDGMESAAISAIDAATSTEQIDTLLVALKTEANQALTTLTAK